MEGKFILISGRPGSGKTELVLHYCNAYPEKTLLLAEEYSKEYIIERGLNSEVTVATQKEFDVIELEKFNTIVIEYIELFDKSIIQDIVKKALCNNMRIIVVSHMKRNFSMNDILATSQL